MPPRARATVSTLQNTIDQHAEWLNLLRPDGPFISAKFLADAFPQGLDTVETPLRTRLRQAWAELEADPATLNRAWQHLVLDEVLGYRGQALRQGSMLPRELTAGTNADGGTAPDAVLMGPADPATGMSGLAERALIYRRPWNESLTRAAKGLPSLAEQAAQLCRRRAIPIALLTNGRLWTLVHARSKEPATVAEFDADTWFDEPMILRAFVSLLGSRHAAASPRNRDGTDTDSLAALFAKTAEDTTSVTKTLGRQVREAVQLLVAELSRLDRDSYGQMLAGVEPRTVYRGALTVMMRVVFLLYAEEQNLLPLGDELYADSYSIMNLYERLDLGDGAIADRWQAAWPALLATFRAVHGGARHPDMWIPAYGGSLFDPTRFPWLESVAITDRVVFAILDALIKLKRTNGDIVTSTERLSYKGLDVEQIGHVYEGLLEYSAVRLDETHLALKGKKQAEASLAALEAWQVAGKLDTEVRALAGLTAPQYARALAIQPTGADTAMLDAACDNKAEIAARVLPYFGLLRVDLRGEPIVHPAGTVIIAQVGDRRDTGTHYTPRALAEEIVVHTLDPLCFSPGSPDGLPRNADGTQPTEWSVRPAEELLALKVLDPAMGSGAFLVSACRYLSERVVEA